MGILNKEKMLEKMENIKRKDTTENLELNQQWNETKKGSSQKRIQKMIELMFTSIRNKCLRSKAEDLSE